jgi:flagellar motor switch protein FliG
LISALDDQSADAILAQLGAEDATKVRSALVELDDISPDEQQQALAAFFSAQGSSSAPSSDAAESVVLELNPALEAAVAAQKVAEPAARALQPVNEPSFAFLEAIDAKAIAAVLSLELPQTVALVVAHLPPEQAAAVLQELPSSLATDALERIAWIGEPAADIQWDVIRVLQVKLAPHLRAAGADATSLARVSAVLGAMDYRQRERVVLQLGERNQFLLDRLGLTPAKESTSPHSVVSLRYRLDPRGSAPRVSPREPKAPRQGDDSVWLTFEDLLQFNDAALRAVFAAADTEVALLALTGAEPRLIARILRKLPPSEATVLRNRLEHPGPLRLRDVEQARFALAAVASRLAHEGAIELPASVRFAAAI